MTFMRRWRASVANAWVSAGDDPKIHVGTELLALRMDGKDRRALLQVRQGDLHLPVEPAGPEQRRVQGLGPVRGRHHHDAGRRIEAVHLRQQLVQGLLALVVGNDGATPACADRVDLIDEHDGGSTLPSLHEQVAHARCANADEDLDEGRAGDGEERNPGLAGDGSGHEGLARPGRADHQHALGADRSHLRVAVRVLQEVHDLRDLLLRPLVACDVGEAGRGLLRVVELRPRAGQRAEPAGQLPPGPSAEEDEQPDEQQERQQAQDHREDRGGSRALSRDLHVMLIQKRSDSVVLQGDRDLGAVPCAVRQLADNAPVGVDRRGLDLVPSNVIEELRVGEGFGSGSVHAGAEQEQDGERDPQEDQPVPPRRRGRRRRTFGSAFVSGIRRSGRTRSVLHAPSPVHSWTRSRDGPSNRDPRLVVLSVK